MAESINLCGDLKAPMTCEQEVILQMNTDFFSPRS